MKKYLLITVQFFFALAAGAQFPPPAGQAGTTAIHKDSSVFVAWATGCTVVRGYMDISDPGLGYASAGDSSLALGQAGSNATVSLGDGGYAILTFSQPLMNGPGWDFAVFENAFSDTFLELAFVEVSSDGVNFYRFPPTSNTQDTVQINGFGNVDATKLNNLAGKYRALYGTPFDLQELISAPLLDVNNVTHIKIIDVVGCIQPAYATDDVNGRHINDPWNTPFASGGFDLDAVGLIYTAPAGFYDMNSSSSLFSSLLFSGGEICFSSGRETIINYRITDITGRTVASGKRNCTSGNNRISLSDNYLSGGIYLVQLEAEGQTATVKIFTGE